MPWLTLARHEREDFASFLESLTPEQWEAPTLCDRWNVRQVAAHAISFDELGGRAIGAPRTIPPERLRVALDFTRYSPTISGALKARGLRLVATDLDWSHGDGAVVDGAGEALLTAMAGRAGALKDLNGPGTDKLASRL